MRVVIMRSKQRHLIIYHGLVAKFGVQTICTECTLLRGDVDFRQFGINCWKTFIGLFNKTGKVVESSVRIRRLCYKHPKCI